MPRIKAVPVRKLGSQDEGTVAEEEKRKHTVDFLDEGEGEEEEEQAVPASTSLRRSKKRRKDENASDGEKIEMAENSPWIATATSSPLQMTPTQSRSSPVFFGPLMMPPSHGCVRFINELMRPSPILVSILLDKVKGLKIYRIATHVLPGLPIARIPLEVEQNAEPVENDNKSTGTLNFTTLPLHAAVTSDVPMKSKASDGATLAVPSNLSVEMNTPQAAPATPLGEALSSDPYADGELLLVFPQDNLDVYFNGEKIFSIGRPLDAHVQHLRSLLQDMATLSLEPVLEPTPFAKYDIVIRVRNPFERCTVALAAIVNTVFPVVQRMPLFTEDKLYHSVKAKQAQQVGNIYICTSFSL